MGSQLCNLSISFNCVADDELCPNSGSSIPGKYAKASSLNDVFSVSAVVTAIQD